MNRIVAQSRIARQLLAPGPREFLPDGKIAHLCSEWVLVFSLRQYYPVQAMNKILVVILVLFLLLAAILVIGGCSSYNGLVNRSQAVDAQWAQVQNVYQRRADLVPNLVATVSGAANFEKSTLTEVTEARASVGRVQVNPGSSPSADQLAQFDKAQGQLGSALSRLLVVSENYPNLKATANFQELQSQLEGTENRISVERGRFNDLARDYNSSIKRVPAVFFAAAMGFKEKAYFTATAGAEKPPSVQFDFSKKEPAKP
jgi:LemA protein